jgi:hypothetical protein
MNPQPVYREPFGVVYQALPMPEQTSYPLAPRLLPYNAQEMVMQTLQLGVDPSAPWHGDSR